MNFVIQSDSGAHVRAKVTSIIMAGEHTSAQATEVIELAMGGCMQLDAAMRQCLRDAVTA